MRKTLHLIKLRMARNFWTMLAIAVAGTAFAAGWWQFDVLGIHDDERGAYDDGLDKFTGNSDFPWKYVPGGEVRRSQDIVIVAIDDKTFADINQHEPWRQRYGAFPYDRVLWADLFGFLQKVGSRGIVFDAVMDESKSDVSGDIALGRQIEDDGIPLYLGFTVVAGAAPLPKHPKPVNRGAPQPKPPPPPVVVTSETAADDPFAVAFPEEPSPEEAARAREAKLAALRKSAAEAYAFPIEARGELEVPRFNPPPGLKEEEAEKLGAQYPVPAIEQVIGQVAGFGTVDHEPDSDGKMRLTRFVYSDGVNQYVTLPVAVAADAFGAEKVELEPGVLKLGNHRIPINPEGDAEIDYGGKLYERFDTVPVVDVLRYMAGAPGAEARFRGKYVFVAGFAVGTGDIKATPLETATPAVVKQAAVLQNLLDGRFIVRAPYWVSLLFAFGMAFLSATLVLVVRNTFVDIGWPVLIYVGFFVVTGSFLVATKIHLLSAMPALAGTLASVIASAWDRMFARQDRERMKQQFQNFMEADLVELMVEHRTLPKLDGDNINVTAFFSDIRGFSTFSEKFKDDPKGLMRLLNRYLSTVTPVLTAEGACIDKYIGDAVVGLFGAPLSYPDHALRACRAALKANRAIGELCEQFRKEGLPDVYTRIGLNTDTMLVGNIGSEQLLDYTALGDGMNLAARLEGANKAFGTTIMIGSNTYDAVKEHVECRELDRVRVAGKHQASEVYELLSLKGELEPTKAKVISLYSRALALYRQRKFEEATPLLQEGLALDQEDGPSHRLLKRCQAFIASPPPPDWDGVSDLEK